MPTYKPEQASAHQEQEERLILPDELARELATTFPEKRVTLVGNDGEVEFQSIPGPDKVQ